MAGGELNAALNAHTPAASQWVSVSYDYCAEPDAKFENARRMGRGKR